MSALEAILATVPAEYREPLGTKSSAKEAWEAIAVMRVGSDRAKKAIAQCRVEMTTRGGVNSRF